MAAGNRDRRLRLKCAPGKSEGAGGDFTEQVKFIIARKLRHFIELAHLG